MTINLLIWNIYKGQKKEHFHDEFLYLSQNKDILLIQEAINDHYMNGYLEKHFSDFKWLMAESFKYYPKNAFTGVAIGSKAAAKSSIVHITEEKEFFVFTPKSTLISEYDLFGKKILVVCTHLLNFVTNTVFSKSLYDIAEKIKHFKGPMVFAGDFNTWSLKRYLIMKNILHEIGLEHVEINEDPRFLKLDHLFVRGFEVIKAKIHTEIKGSDHLPIDVELRIRD